MYISGAVIGLYALICTIVFIIKYRNLRVVQIEKTVYGLGDLIFFVITGFEFL